MKTDFGTRRRLTGQRASLAADNERGRGAVLYQAFPVGRLSQVGDIEDELFVEQHFAREIHQRHGGSPGFRRQPQYAPAALRCGYSFAGPNLWRLRSRSDTPTYTATRNDVRDRRMAR